MSHIWALFHPLTGPLGPLAVVLVVLIALSAVLNRRERR